MKPLIPSAENGLFSRQLFYCMPPIREWVDQFCESGIDYDRMFTLWGERWKCRILKVKFTINTPPSDSDKKD